VQCPHRQEVYRSRDGVEGKRQIDRLEETREKTKARWHRHRGRVRMGGKESAEKMEVKTRHKAGKT
jgi:hypothetical protein